MNNIERIARVRLMAFDVDGVLTDGGLLLGPDGAEWKRFHAHDGAGISVALRAGYPVALITGRRSAAVERRAQELGVQLLFQDVKDKVPVMEQLMESQGLSWRQVMFMGDDLPDLPAMRLAGLAVAPASAVTDVREAAHVITSHDGGMGAVREAIEMVLRNQGQWGAALEEYFAERARLAQ